MNIASCCQRNIEWTINKRLVSGAKGQLEFSELPYIL